MKKFFQKILSFLGYRISSIKKNNIKDFDETLKKVFRDSKLNIIDIGANSFQSIKRFQKLS